MKEGNPMIMNVETNKTIVEFRKTSTDKMNIGGTISFLRTIQNLDEEKDLVSPITGEVIQVKELSRVIGILEGLRDYPIWIVEDD